MGFFKNADSVPDPYANPGNRKAKILVIGLIAVVLIGIGTLLVALLGSGGKEEYMALIGKASSLQKTADESQKRIRDRNLAKINSEYTLLLGTDVNAMMQQLQKKFGEKQISENAKKQATDSTIAKKLNDGELLNKFDFAYQNIMRQKIAEMLTSAQKVKNEVGGKDFTAVMDTFINNLKAINKQLEELNLVASN